MRDRVVTETTIVLTGWFLLAASWNAHGTGKLVLNVAAILLFGSMLIHRAVLILRGTAG